MNYTLLTISPSNVKPRSIFHSQHHPREHSSNIMTTLTTKPCASCNTPSTETHPLQRCGKCKDINYCNKACQRADWQAHKSVCSPTADIIATLKEVLLEDGGQLKLHKKASIPYGASVAKEMPPTDELPLGHQKLTIFPPKWLASIAHLLVAEQNEAKAEYAIKKDEAEEAQLTPEQHEALRLQAKKFGELQQKANARQAAKDAEKYAAKGSGSK